MGMSVCSSGSRVGRSGGIQRDFLFGYVPHLNLLPHGTVERTGRAHGPAAASRHQSNSSALGWGLKPGIPPRSDSAARYRPRLRISSPPHNGAQQCQSQRQCHHRQVQSLHDSHVLSKTGFGSISGSSFDPLHTSLQRSPPRNVTREFPVFATNTVFGCSRTKAFHKHAALTVVHPTFETQSILNPHRIKSR